jgi:dipeptidyl aminopeptidase/acylaminoacyl peptidase
MASCESRKTGVVLEVPSLRPFESEGTGEPRWSPDGSRIAFETVSGAKEIRVITSSGADVAAISFGGSEIGTPAWTANGRSIVFPGRDQKGRRLWRVALAHPEKLQATPYSGWLAVRFRGNELYGMRYDAPGVWRIDGVPRRITQKPSLEWSNEWAISGNEIVYADDPLAKHRQLMAQPIAGGPARVMAQVPNYTAANGFAVDPTDGTGVYTATLNESTHTISTCHRSARAKLPRLMREGGLMHAKNPPAAERPAQNSESGFRAPEFAFHCHRRQSRSADFRRCHRI